MHLTTGSCCKEKNGNTNISAKYAFKKKGVLFFSFSLIFFTFDIFDIFLNNPYLILMVSIFVFVAQRLQHFPCHLPPWQVHQHQIYIHNGRDDKSGLSGHDLTHTLPTTFTARQGILKYQIGWNTPVL